MYELIATTRDEAVVGWGLTGEIMWLQMNGSSQSSPEIKLINYLINYLNLVYHTADQSDNAGPLQKQRLVCTPSTCQLT